MSELLIVAAALPAVYEKPLVVKSKAAIFPDFAVSAPASVTIKFPLPRLMDPFVIASVPASRSNTTLLFASFSTPAVIIFAVSAPVRIIDALILPS